MASGDRARMAQPARAKCARCSGDIPDDDPVVFEHGDLFHRVCWMVVMSDARIANARQLASLAHERVERGRASVKDDPAPA
jgi:hypothetical protein